MEQQVIEAVRAAWKEGCPVASDVEKVARLAIRRWQSSGRRGVKQNDQPARVRDLAKGLIDALEPDPALVGRLKADYLYLSQKIAESLNESTENA